MIAVVIPAISVRAVRTELVEVQSRVRSNGARATETFNDEPSVRKFAALPFDGLRANGSFSGNFKPEFVVTHCSECPLDVRLSPPAAV